MVEVRQKAKRRREGGAATDIKSNAPHLAGGEQKQPKWKQPSKQQDVENQAGVEQGVGRVEPSTTYARVGEGGGGGAGSS